MLYEVITEPFAYACRFMPAGRRRERVAMVALAAMDRFVACARTYIGMRLRYERAGFDAPERCIVVSNHQSLLDIPVLMHYFRKERRLLFVAKKELGYVITSYSIHYTKLYDAPLRLAKAPSSRIALVGLPPLSISAWPPTLSTLDISRNNFV